jgi:ActR/RegA family two-component response regulator
VAIGYDHGYDGQLCYLGLALDAACFEAFVQGCLETIGEDNPEAEQLFRGLWEYETQRDVVRDALLSQRVAMMLSRVMWKHESVLVGSQREDRRVGEVGRPKSETARRFGIHRATLKRYCKQLDERGTLQPSKAPDKKPKLDGKTKKQPR